METRTAILFYFLLVQGLRSSGQDSLWKEKVFNDVLTLRLPSGAEHKKSDYIEAFGGAVHSSFFGFQYYDSVFQKVENEGEFEASLEGFITGRVQDPSLKGYRVALCDTTMNGTTGLMAMFSAPDREKQYPLIYYFVTMANNRFYWFYAYSPLSNGSKAEIEQFFGSIRFNLEKMEESHYRLKPVHVTTTL